MIKCKDNLGTYILDDELNCIGTSEKGVKLVEDLVKLSEPLFRPENGSPTLIVANRLEECGYTIIRKELPLIEQLEDTIF